MKKQTVKKTVKKPSKVVKTAEEKRDDKIWSEGLKKLGITNNTVLKFHEPTEKGNKNMVALCKCISRDLMEELIATINNHQKNIKKVKITELTTGLPDKVKEKQFLNMPKCKRAGKVNLKPSDGYYKKDDIEWALLCVRSLTMQQLKRLDEEIVELCLEKRETNPDTFGAIEQGQVPELKLKGVQLENPNFSTGTKIKLHGSYPVKIAPLFGYTPRTWTVKLDPVTKKTAKKPKS